MTSHLFARFIHALWLGSGVFLMAIAAPAAFRMAPNSGVAGDIVGAMMSRWHYIALAAPLLLLFLDWRRGRVHVLAIVFVAIVFAAGQAAVDLRIRAMRNSSPIPIGQLDREDPLRRAFGRLHGLSSMLMLGQVICAALALALDREAYPAAGAAAVALRPREPEVTEVPPSPNDFSTAPEEDLIAEEAPEERVEPPDPVAS